MLKIKIRKRTYVYYFIIWRKKIPELKMKRNKTEFVRIVKTICLVKFCFNRKDIKNAEIINNLHFSFFYKHEKNPNEEIRI